MAKQGKKPGYNQRKIIEANGYSAFEWLVAKDTVTEMELVHRETGERKTIRK